MKRLLFLLMSVLPLMASAQSLAKYGRSVDEIVPQGMKCQKAEGDLNKDGRSDLVVCTGSMLAIYFATTDGGYKLWKQYDEVLPIDEDGDDQTIEISMEVTERGTLKIDVNNSFASGSSYMCNNSYIYRYQKGNFYLIGEDRQETSRITGVEQTQSFNYLTHKCQTIEENVFDEDVKTKEKWTSIPKKPLKKLGSETMY